MARISKWVAAAVVLFAGVGVIVTVPWAPAQDAKTTAGGAKSGTEKTGTEKTGAAKAGTEKAGKEKAGTEKAGTEKTAAAKEPAKVHEKTAAFRKLKGELEDLIKQLHKIQQEYRAADKDGRPAWEKQFDEKKAAAKKLLPQLNAAAEAAVAVDPTDPDVVDHLGALVYQASEKQSTYEEALRLAQLVLDKQPAGTKFRRPELFRYGAASAFFAAKANGDDNAAKFATAEKYLSELLKPDYSADDSSPAPKLREQLKTERELWDQELQRQQAEKKVASDPQALPRVRLKTTQGEIELELFENEAPNTVANFITLIRQKFYNGKPFDQVSRSQVRAGEPKETDKDVNYTIADECNRKDFRRHFRGSLAMSVPQGKDTGCSEFVILLEPARDRDAKLIDKNNPTDGVTVFGRVVSGMDVLSKLRQGDQPPPTTESQASGPEKDRILEATVIHDRGHKYEVKKLDKGKTEPAKSSTDAKPPAGKTDTEKTPAKTEPAKTP